MKNQILHTPIYRYAGRIKRDWLEMPKSVKTEVQKMFTLDQINQGNADVVVKSFLNNAKAWRGVIAREVKSDLRRIMVLQ